jgi:GT2 family glycosyltransferase
MVGVVIVNYNSQAEVLRLASSLDQQTYQDFFLVIVDNNSPDGSGIGLQEKLSKAEVILNGSNEGFAAGVNLGIEYLKKKASPPNFFWILNPDMELDPNALEALLRSGGNKKSIVGSKVLYPPDQGGQIKIWSAGGFVDFTNQQTVMRGNGEIDRGQFNESTNLDYVPGCSLFTSKEVLEELGPFPEEYFLYFEETDWCQRAKRKGIAVVYEPKSVVTHFFREEKLSEPLVTYYYNRNKRLFFSRYSGFVARIKIFLKTLLKDLPQAKKSLTESPDERYRLLFESHIDSCLDFIFMRFGKRDKEL